MKTYKRTVKQDKKISNDSVSFHLKKGNEVITSATKNGVCYVFTDYWFKAPTKWFKNVRINTN